jgi:tRNA(fMet)-specific endonuclease VapC
LHGLGRVDVAKALQQTRFSPPNLSGPSAEQAMEDAHERVSGADEVSLTEEERQGCIGSVTGRPDGDRDLADLFEFFAEFDIAAFDDRAVDRFEDLRAAKLRLRTMDLKIAATALENQAILLSPKRSHSGRLPELGVENWLD